MPDPEKVGKEVEQAVEQASAAAARAGLPLTASERKELLDRIAELEKRPTVADVRKIVSDVLEERAAAAGQEDAEAAQGTDGAGNDW
jgi:acyl-CoA reductase-like NAD-dependent aldehyde dehydrogenase